MVVPRYAVPVPVAASAGAMSSLPATTEASLAVEVAIAVIATGETRSVPELATPDAVASLAGARSEIEALFATPVAFAVVALEVSRFEGS